MEEGLLINGGNEKIVVNAGIKLKQGKFIATIYSTPFARYLLSIGTDRVNLDINEERIIIDSGNEKKVTFERKKEKHPLITIAISKLISDEFKEKIRNNNGQLPIKAILKNITSKELIRNDNKKSRRAEPKKWDISTPKENLLKIACCISCFRQNKNKWYRFTVRHRIFEQIIKRGLKVDLCRIGNEFFLKTNPEGNKMSFHKNKDGHAMAYMQISSSFLNKDEMNLFEKGRCSISSRAFLCNKDFGFDISEFFYDLKEKELVKALVNKGIPIQVPEMGKREADILLPKIGGQIEVTTIMPVGIAKNKNNAHGEGVHINARLCEGFVRVTNNKINKFFVVLYKDWMDYLWVKELYEMIKPKVILIPTDFEGNWAEKTVETLTNHLKNEPN